MDGQFEEGIGFRAELRLLSTNERLQDMREGKMDPGLPLLYFNHGRYLLVASSARGERPANLQAL